MLNKPLLGLTVAAMLMIQVMCVALHWNAIRRGNVDFAALIGTARLIGGGKVPNYDSLHVGVDTDATDQQEDRVNPNTMSDTLHPPFESLLFLPLTFFPYLTAFVIWTISNLIFFWSVPAVLKDFLPRLRPEASWLAVIYATSLPVLVCLMFGQDSILLLFLFSFSASSLASNNDIRAGFLLALGLFKFQLVFPIFIVLIVLRRWRALAGFFYGSLSLLIAAVWMIGVEGILRYIRFLFAVTHHISTNTSTRTVLMPNLRGLVSLLSGSSNHPTAQSFVIFVLSIAAIVGFVAWSRKFRELPIRYHFSLAVLVSSLISYHYYIYNAVILSIPFLLMANEFIDTKVHSKLRVIFAVSVFGSYGILLLSVFGILPLEIGMAALTLGSIGVVAVTASLPFSAITVEHEYQEA